jgi:hypothetical protein
MIVHEESRRASLLLHSKQGERIQLQDRMQLKEHNSRIQLQAEREQLFSD